MAELSPPLKREGDQAEPGGGLSCGCPIEPLSKRFASINGLYKGCQNNRQNRATIKEINIDEASAGQPSPANAVPLPFQGRTRDVKMYFARIKSVLEKGAARRLPL